MTVEIETNNKSIIKGGGWGLGVGGGGGGVTSSVSVVIFFYQTYLGVDMGLTEDFQVFNDGSKTSPLFRCFVPSCPPIAYNKPIVI